MRAILVKKLGSIDNGELAEVDDPEPSAGEVQVAVHAVAVNYVDIVTITGNYQFKPPLPYIPGKGPAGVVTKVGAGVTCLKPGQRVLAMVEREGFAELVKAPENQCYVLPDGLGFAEAASMSVAFDTAWMALRERGRIAAGEWVLVLGSTGAVGMAAVQLAKAMGANVIAAVSSPARFAGPKAAGADAMLDLSQPDLRESLRSQVFEATGGRGVDIVLDMLGGDIFDAAIRAVAWRGRLVVLGFAAGGIPSLKVNYVMLKNMEVSGMQISDYRRQRPDLVAQAFAEIFAFFEAGRVQPLPHETLPLADYAKAMHAIDERRTSGRQVLLTR